jgi:hypothetical protein
LLGRVVYFVQFFRLWPIRGEMNRFLAEYGTRDQDSRNEHKGKHTVVKLKGYGLYGFIGDLP